MNAAITVSLASVDPNSHIFQLAKKILNPTLENKPSEREREKKKRRET